MGGKECVFVECNLLGIKKCFWFFLQLGNFGGLLYIYIYIYQYVSEWVNLLCKKTVVQCVKKNRTQKR